MTEPFDRDPFNHTPEPAGEAEQRHIQQLVDKVIEGESVSVWSQCGYTTTDGESLFVNGTADDFNPSELIVELSVPGHNGQPLMQLHFLPNNELKDAFVNDKIGANALRDQVVETTSAMLLAIDDPNPAERMVFGYLQRFASYLADNGEEVQWNMFEQDTEGKGFPDHLRDMLVARCPFPVLVYEAETQIGDQTITVHKYDEVSRDDESGYPDTVITVSDHEGNDKEQFSVSSDGDFEYWQIGNGISMEIPEFEGPSDNLEALFSMPSSDDGVLSKTRAKRLIADLHTWSLQKAAQQDR